MLSNANKCKYLLGQNLQKICWRNLLTTPYLSSPRLLQPFATLDKSNPISLIWRHTAWLGGLRSDKIETIEVSDDFFDADDDDEDFCPMSGQGIQSSNTFLPLYEVPKTIRW